MTDRPNIEENDLIRFRGKVYKVTHKEHNYFYAKPLVGSLDYIIFSWHVDTYIHNSNLYLKNFLKFTSFSTDNIKYNTELLRVEEWPFKVTNIMRFINEE